MDAKEYSGWRGQEKDHHVIHACNNGWVSMEVETEDGTLEEVLYLCKRCAEEKTKRAEGV